MLSFWTVPAKTNALRVLDARGIDHRVTEYDARQEFHDAAEVARLVGAVAETVYKTLVVLRDEPGRTRPLLVLVAADSLVDLKRLAAIVGAKRLRMATQREAEALTGLRVGGISPLALVGRGFEVLLDASAERHERVHVSAGVRGVDVELTVRDLIDVTGARIVTGAARPA